MTSLRVAVVMMSAQRYMAMFMNLAMMVVVSRLLLPSEIGLSVIGASLSTIVLSIREFSGTPFLVQKKDLSLNDKRAVVSVLAVVTLAAICTLLAISKIIGDAYDQPVLVNFLRVNALAAAFDLVVLPIQGVMQREMAFLKIAVIAITGVSVNTIATIGLALLGFGTMSFAWAALIAGVLMASLSLVLHRDLSIFRPTATGWGAVISFSAYNGVNQVLTLMYNTVPGLILGRAVSANAVGHYNRAIGLCLLPDKVFLSGIIAVAMPAFSAKNRENISLREPYLRGIGYITALQWPALVTLAILAHPMVGILLGSQWTGTVPVIQIIAPALLFSFSFVLNFPVLVSVGAMREVFVLALAIWPASTAVLSVAALWGLHAVALSMFVVVPLQAVLAMNAVRRHIAFSWRDIMRAVAPSAFITAVTMIGPLSVVAYAGFTFRLDAVEGVLAGMLAAPCWLAALWFTGHPLLDELLSAARAARDVCFRRRRMLGSGLIGRGGA